MIAPWILIALGVIILVAILFRTMNQVFIFSLVKKNFFWVVFFLVLLFISFSVYHIHTTYTLDLTTWEGVTGAAKLYFVWFKGVVANAGKITGYAINQDWFLNSTK